MPHHHADAAEIRGTRSTRSEEWWLKNAGREHDFVLAWIVISIHFLWQHFPLTSIHWLRQFRPRATVRSEISSHDRLEQICRSIRHVLHFLDRFGIVFTKLRLVHYHSRQTNHCTRCRRLVQSALTRRLVHPRRLRHSVLKALADAIDVVRRLDVRLLAECRVSKQSAHRESKHTFCHTHASLPTGSFRVDAINSFAVLHLHLRESLA
mmetsp:Transcript_6987/g.18097  ORF Transcript_6987/g.18097 Transcript_6987/m.18097 type:complete len:208 (+) Transcript_6987:703-1326(+)